MSTDRHSGANDLAVSLIERGDMNNGLISPPDPSRPYITAALYGAPVMAALTGTRPRRRSRTDSSSSAPGPALASAPAKESEVEPEVQAQVVVEPEVCFEFVHEPEPEVEVETRVGASGGEADPLVATTTVASDVESGKQDKYSSEPKSEPQPEPVPEPGPDPSHCSDGLDDEPFLGSSEENSSLA